MTRWIIDEFAMSELTGAARRDDPFHLFSEGPDEAAAILSEAIEGRRRSSREAFAERLGGRRTKLSRHSAEMLAHRGIDPLAFCVLSGKCASFSIMHPEDEEDDVTQAYGERAVSGPSDLSGFVRLSPTVVWDLQGHLTVEGLPESVVASLSPGMELRSVVDHPIVSTWSTRTSGIRRETFGPREYVHLDVPPTCVTLDAADLLAIQPRVLEDA